MLIAGIAAIAVSLLIPSAFAQTTWPNQLEGDFILKDYRFASGEILPELRLHYTTLGAARRDATGGIVNGVLLLHGTGGSGKQWLMPSLANELFGEGQPLDASRYFVILPDGVGRGGSSKPSDGLRGKFPHYIDGGHAHLDVGRDVPRPDGRAGAAREPADCHKRAKLDDPTDAD
jgi:homoserine O-acetyltransferase/O-succinyltransferase